MRTKTIEKKRYSLRAPRKIMRMENEYEERELSLTSEESPPKQIVARMVTKKTKRKGKPVKSASKEEMQEIPLNTPLQMDVRHEVVPIPKPAAHSTPVPVQQSTNKRSLSIEKKIPENESNKCSEFVKPVHFRVTAKPANAHQNTNIAEINDFPVYVALEHAIRCRLEKDCNFQKCGIAKQFLQHSSSCDEKKENCTICKAMDIMLCKHAEKCEIPIDRSCPIPNCDHVRKLMMEEWLKFRSNHHEIVTRAFSGLIHARKCKNKKCDSILCKNIKAVLIHTQTCNKKEDCKTRRFVVQLCEYHQNNCHDLNCSVEFCMEGRKLYAEENTRKQAEQQMLREKQAYSHTNTRPIANLGTLNNTFFPTGLQGFFNLQQQIIAAQNINPMVYPFFPGSLPTIQPPHPPISSGNIQPTAPTSFQQESHESSFNQINISKDDQYCEPADKPSPGVNLPSQSWNEQENHSPCDESQNSSHKNWNVFQQTEDAVQCNSATEVINAEIQEHDFSQSTSLPLEQQASDDQANMCTSPTSDILYQFWPIKQDHPVAEPKEQLQRLSPNELQNILVRDGNTNILSPVHDNRAQFSEPPFLLNEFQPNTQESEMEENPMEVENGENHYHCLTTAEIQVDKMGEIMKNEEEWSKIDFVKEQKIQQGYEVETETADETTENESVCDQQSPNTRDDPEACYYVNNNSYEETSSVGNNNMETNTSNMTSLERNFLAILQAQQRTNPS